MQSTSGHSSQLLTQYALPKRLFENAQEKHTGYRIPIATVAQWELFQNQTDKPESTQQNIPDNSLDETSYLVGVITGIARKNHVTKLFNTLPSSN